MNSSLRELQLTETEMLRDVAAFCDAHGITYYLYCGTLLGCIRHRGFIPWDDDVDIAMPLKDYRRFLKLFPGEMGDKYSLDSIEINPYFDHMWAKVCRNGTTFSTEKELYIQRNCSVSMDVYPMIGQHDNSLKARIQRFMIRAGKAMLNATRYDLAGRPEDGKWHKGYLFCLLPLGLRRSLALKIMRRWFPDPAGCRRIGTVDAALFTGKYDSHLFDELISGEFEGAWYSIPARYHEALKIMYWDYMKLPPEDERKGHQTDDPTMIIDVNRGYMEYIKDRESGRL